MILLAGLESDDCISLVAKSLRAINQPHFVFDQREYAQSSFEWGWSSGRLTGALKTPHTEIRLDTIAGVYLRLEDLAKVTHQSGPVRSPRHEQAAKVQSALLDWTNLTPARVITRDGIGATNYSKPYQLQLIAANGFQVPETIVTNSVPAVEQFVKQHGRVIYKSISGVRSIVQELKHSDVERFGSISECPVQFQNLVEGLDVRVHVVGREVLAVAVETPETDYRYGTQQRFAVYELPESLRLRCIELASSLGLEFAGIDLMITKTGEAYCFEVNPMPGYSWFQLNTTADISGAIARLLAS